MWQKCWNTNQNLIHHLRFRERGPLKSWRPETMAEAIFSVLKEGLSLSQAARKFDIPYPTFVLYANRVHNMLGPSIDGGTDLRPKGRGRPQRILLGIWPDEHIKSVIKSVVFRDAKDFKDDPALHLAYGRHSPVFPFQDGAMNYPVPPCNNGLSAQSPLGSAEALSPDAATAAAVAAMARGLRQQMQMAAVQQHHPDLANYSMPSHLSIHPSGGGGSGRDSKLGSPSQLLSNGNISMSRLDSPNSAHHVALHGLPSLLSGHHSISPDISPVQSHKSASDRHHSSANLHHQMTSPSRGGAMPTSLSNAHHRNASPIERDMDDDNSMDSSLEIPHEPSVNLAVGVSGLSYKSSRDYSSPRSDSLFQDDIASLVGGGGVLKGGSGGNNMEADDFDDCNRTPSSLSNFKEPTTIKIEPIASECRGD